MSVKRTTFTEADKKKEEQPYREILKEIKDDVNKLLVKLEGFKSIYDIENLNDDEASANAVETEDYGDGDISTYRELSQTKMKVVNLKTALLDATKTKDGILTEMFDEYKLSGH